MCFSATASFGASGVLLVIGTASIIKTVSTRQLPFAMIPLIFAVQQFIEGFLWLSFDGRVSVHEEMLIHNYLFFAQVLWPVWIPLAFLWIENNSTRILFLKVFAGIGILVGTFLAYCLLTYEVSAEMTGQHIRYLLNFPKPFNGYGVILYGLATIGPAFVSGVRGVKIFGFLVVISYLVSFFYFREALISVWCYFAAGISISVWFLIPKYSRSRV